MWSLTRNIIFFYIYMNIEFSLADHECAKPGDIFNAEPDDVPLPVVVSKGKHNDRRIFPLVFENQTEDSIVTLYVDPFKSDPNDCLETPKTSANLYEYYESIKSSKSDGDILHEIPKALTGCYYAKITNEREKIFIVPIGYYNGSSKFYDWNPKCIRSVIMPPTPSAGRIFDIVIEVPLQCLKVEMKLFEIEKFLGNETISEARRGIIQPIGNCWFTNTTNSCESTETDFNISRKFNIAKENEHWEAKIEWTKLKESGAYYFSLFSMKNHICQFNYADVMTWQPAYTLSLIDHGNETTSSIPPENSEDSSYTVKLVIFIISGLFFIAILIYFAWMYIKILNKGDKNITIRDQELEERLYIDKILLIYMQSTSDFMNNMQIFKNELKKRCKHEIYDIYSNDEYSAIATLRPYSWVERIMKDGCKVVWIDTPQFRSYLNDRSKLNSDNKKDHIEVDFRDCAIKCALELTKSSFKDSDDHYMYHFVVRLNGLDLTDEPEDPLSMITPHRRFYIPQHFDRLCADLVR